METIIKTDIKLSCSRSKAESLPVFKSEKFNSGKGELTFTKNSSPQKLCWRLVHDGKNIIDLFESKGLTETCQELFCGTEKECQDEITRLGLKPMVYEL